MQTAAVSALAASVVFVAPAPAAAQGCIGGVESDFDGDGVTDVAIGDPRATVSGQESAGRVTVAFGGGGSQTVTQLDLYDNDNAAEDWFGHALASTDWNADGCSDLVVGVPYEDWSSNAIIRAGIVVVIPGSPAGLNPDAATQWHQGSVGQHLEADDRFGWSVAAGTAPSGAPFILVGSPGEDTNDLEDAGLITYRTPSITVSINQDSAGVPGVVEAGDLYGHAVSATSRAIGVGIVGEAIGEDKYSGSVHMYEHPASSSTPAVIAGWDQDMPGFSGDAEPHDLYGFKLDMVDYIPVGGGDEATLVAVGSHGEGIGTADATGRVVVVADDGGVSELHSYSQDEVGVDGSNEPGDHFGYSVAVANRIPGQAATWQNLLMAVGVPGENPGSFPFAGRVQVFSLVGAPGDHDVFASDALAAAGYVPSADARIGQAVHATADYLFIAAPDSDPVAVYGIPWENLTDGASEPAWVIQAGVGGVPSDGVGVFGQAMA